MLEISAMGTTFQMQDHIEGVYCTSLILDSNNED